MKTLLPAVPLKKADPARQELRAAGEGPYPGNAGSETMTDPERDSIAEHRTGDRPRHDREKRQRASRREGSRGNQKRGAGKQQTDKRKGLRRTP